MTIITVDAYGRCRIDNDDVGYTLNEDAFQQRVSSLCNRNTQVRAVYDPDTLPADRHRLQSLLHECGLEVIESGTPTNTDGQPDGRAGNDNMTSELIARQAQRRENSLLDVWNEHEKLVTIFHQRIALLQERLEQVYLDIARVQETYQRLSTHIITDTDSAPATQPSE